MTDGVNKDGKAASDGREQSAAEFNVVGALPKIENNGEDARETLKRLKSENAPPPKKKLSARDVALYVVAVLFFPITLAVIGIRKLFKRFRVGITAKTTIVFTVVFGLMLIGYAAFVLISISKLSGESVTPDYMRRLVVTSAVLVAVFIVLGAVLGGFSSQYMIGPVRKITRRVNEISDENMSARLDQIGRAHV